jgi:CubicO group peptidase (beta-lactamase class C family)
VTETAERLSGVYTVLDRLIADGEVAGAAVAIAVGAKPIGEYYAGFAAPGMPAAPETLWPAASITKLYTAATVMALVERGVLTLGTLVRTVLPAFDGDGRERITLRHLLTHTSGLIYEPPQMEQLLLGQAPLDEIVDEVYRHPLLFPPGTKLNYSDLEFALLGRVASTITGTSFPDLVRTLVLEPAGLADTFLPPPAREYGRIAYVSGPTAEGTDGAMYNSPYARDLAHPAFGVIATAGDLLRFGLLFAPNGHRILAGATIQTMTTDQTDGHAPEHTDAPSTGAPYPWGLGFMLKRRLPYPELLSPAAFGHDGATGCTLWIDPTYDLTIAFVSNRHLNAVGYNAFEQRLNRVMNAAVVCLTRPG